MYRNKALKQPARKEAMENLERGSTLKLYAAAASDDGGKATLQPESLYQKKYPHACVPAMRIPIAESINALMA